MYKKIKLLTVVGVLASGIVQAQTENSPYSRYGLGDELPSQNILARGMGGVSAAYSDVLTVNYTNPASYAKLKRASLDIGLELDSRTLKVIDPPRKFNSLSPNISYVQLGIPLSQKKNWGMNFGLRPVTRINYNIETNERLPGVDSVSTLYQGNGGSYEVYAGTGFTILKNLSLGFNIGYLFGSKNYSTTRSFVADSAYVFYYPGKVSNNTSYGGLSGNAGLQYQIRLNKKNLLRIGAYGSIKREMNATQNQVTQTFSTSESRVDTIDVIVNNSTSGKITYPGTFGVGTMFYAGDRWLLGADYSQTNWKDYQYFGKHDQVQNSWNLHIGGQILPNFAAAKSYWGRVIYRAGFTYGQDYVKVDKDLPLWGVSVGFGLPMRPPSYTNQYSIINTAIEFGQRGNNTNVIRENYLRISVGLTLSDIWFIKKQYD